MIKQCIVFHKSLFRNVLKNRQSYEQRTMSLGGKCKTLSNLHFFFDNRNAPKSRFIYPLLDQFERKIMWLMIDWIQKRENQHKKTTKLENIGGEASHSRPWAGPVGVDRPLSGAFENRAICHRCQWEGVKIVAVGSPRFEKRDSCGTSGQCI